MDRREAIAKLKNFADHCDPNEVFLMAIEALSAEPREALVREWCKQNGYVMMRESDYEQAITKAYFEGQNASTSEIPNKWIPVSERLPEKEGKYLTTIFNGIRYIMTCDYHPYSRCWFPDDECASDNVIAWMPLPEPYEPQKSEEVR